MAPTHSARTALAKEADRLRSVEARIRKIKLREAERLLVIAEAAGWFDAEVPDERLAAAFAHLVREAKATTPANDADAGDAASPAPTDGASAEPGTG